MTISCCSWRGGYRPHVALGEEGCRPHVALVLEEVHCLHALDGLDFLVAIEEELVELDEERDDAHVLGKSFLELHREVLLDVHELVILGWLRLDLIREGHTALQELELHIFVVLDVVPRHLVHLDVVVLAPLVLVVVVVAVLVLARMQLVFGVVDARESRCRVEDCGLLDGLDARHDEECSMSVYLNRR